MDELLERAASSTLDEKDCELIRAIFAVVCLRDRPGRGQEHIDSPAAPAALRRTHREDRRRRAAQRGADGERSAADASTPHLNDSLRKTNRSAETLTKRTRRPRKVMVATAPTPIVAPSRSRCRMSRWRRATPALNAGKARFTKWLAPACWFASWDKHPCMPRFITCRNCAAICAARCLRPNRPRTRALGSTMRQPAA